MVKRTHLILGVSILVLFVILSTGILKNAEGFQSTSEYLTKLESDISISFNKVTSEEKNNKELIKGLNTATSPANINAYVQKIDASNDKIMKGYAEILRNKALIATRLEKDAERAVAASNGAPRDTKKSAEADKAKRDALAADRSYSKTAGDAAKAATLAVSTSKAAVDKSSTTVSSVKATLDSQNRTLTELNNKFNSANAEFVKTTSLLSRTKNSHDTSYKEYKIAQNKHAAALDNLKKNKVKTKTQALQKVATDAQRDLAKGRDKYQNNLKPFQAASRQHATQSAALSQIRNSLNAIKNNVANTTNMHAKNSAISDGAKSSLTKATSASTSAATLADSLAKSVNAKVDAQTKAASAQAAVVSAKSAVAAAASDVSKKPAAKAAADTLAKAKADAAIAEALAKKAAEDKAAAAAAAKKSAEAAAREDAAQKAATAAKIAAANAAAKAAADAAKKEADRVAAKAKQDADKKAAEALEAKKRADKAKAEIETASAAAKQAAIQRAAKLKADADAAAKLANAAKQANVAAKDAVKDMKQNVSIVKKEAIVEVKNSSSTKAKIETVTPSNIVLPVMQPKSVQSLPQVQPQAPAQERRSSDRSLVINNMIPAPQPPMASDQPNSFLTSAVGGFLGAGIGGLLGSAAGSSMNEDNDHDHHDMMMYNTSLQHSSMHNAAMQNAAVQSLISENAALRAEQNNRPGISITPNTMYMGEYEEPRDTTWTRGGRDMRHHARHRRHDMDEYNDEDPETARWPGRNLEPTNLFSIERDRRNSRRHSGSCNETCGCDVPLTRRPNIERDYSRE